MTSIWIKCLEYLIQSIYFIFNCPFASCKHIVLCLGLVCSRILYRISYPHWYSLDGWSGSLRGRTHLDKLQSANLNDLLILSCQVLYIFQMLLGLKLIEEMKKQQLFINISHHTKLFIDSFDYVTFLLRGLFISSIVSCLFSWFRTISHIRILLLGHS